MEEFKKYLDTYDRGYDKEDEKEYREKVLKPKRKAELKRRNREMIRSLGLEEHSMSEEAVEDLGDKLYSATQFACLDGQTIEHAMTEKNFAVYVGYTKRTEELEGGRFMTPRGANEYKKLRNGKKVHSGNRNRPVYNWPDGTCITMGDAETHLGMVTEFVHYDRMKDNALRVEDALQTRMNAFPLGLRLHRHVAMGDKTVKPRSPSFLAKVFITTFPITHIAMENTNKRKITSLKLNNKRVKVVP